MIHNPSYPQTSYICYQMISCTTLGESILKRITRSFAQSKDFNLDFNVIYYEYRLL